MVKTNQHISKQKTDPYFQPEYNSKERFNAFWHQINEIVKHNPGSVLEIGIGSGFVKKYLIERGIDIVSLDIADELKPDIVGTVLEVPFREHQFDMVACYEVLEHLPYDRFVDALIQLYTISKRYVFLSLPDVTTTYRIFMELPRLRKTIQMMISHPFHKPTTHQFDGYHYWEIGRSDFLLKRIKRDIEKAGFSIKKTYRVFEFKYIRIFVLEKI